MLTTTLNRIKACNPCNDGWQRGLNAAGKAEADDESISYEAILDAVGLQHALWCCRAEPQYSSLWRRYAVWCARQVQHLMADPRSIAALDVAERHANGEATDEELYAASDAAEAASDDAWDAAWGASDDAWDAAWGASDAAEAASDAAEAAAYSAARAAVMVAVRDAAFGVADVVVWSAADAVRDAATKDAQAAAFRQLVTTGTLPPVQPIQEAIQ